MKFNTSLRQSINLKTNNFSSSFVDEKINIHNNEILSHSNKADKTIFAIGTATQTLDNNTQYTFCTNSAPITVTLPADLNNDYISGFTFTSGITSTTLTYPAEIKFSGADCKNNIFVPIENKTYQVIVSKVGTEIWGDVDAR